MGLSSAEVSNIPPTTLLHGSGEQVCLLLNKLIDIVLYAKKYSFQKFIYEKDENNNDDMIIRDNDQNDEELAVIYN
jgi:hypothetical protein